METMIEVLLTLDDIDKSQIIPLKSGKKAYRATLIINDEVDQYGQNVAGWAKQTQEEREAKTKRKYFANGTCFWSDGKVTVVNKDNPKGKVVSESPVVAAEPQAFTGEADNLPF